LVGLVGPTHFQPEDAAHSPKISLKKTPFQIVTKPHNMINTNNFCLPNTETFPNIQVFWKHSGTAEDLGLQQQHFAEHQILPPATPPKTKTENKKEQQQKNKK